MATSLAGLAISASFGQLAHFGGSLTSAESPIYSGAGVVSSLQVGTVSTRVGNIRLQGNTISTVNTNGNMVLTPNGTGKVVIGRAQITGGSISGITPLAVADGGTGASAAPAARLNLGLGTMATQNAASVNITGGTISGVTLVGSFLLSTLTAAVSVTAGNLVVSGNSLAATNSNGDVILDALGTGRVLFAAKAAYVAGQGLGGAVTQVTSKSTAVTLNRAVGTILTHNEASDPGDQFTFRVNSSLVDALDAVVLNHVDGGTVGVYHLQVDRVAAGSFDITITDRRTSGSGLSEALQIRFMVFGGSAT